MSKVLLRKKGNESRNLKKKSLKEELDWSVRKNPRMNGIVENICRHGVGHPTEESAKAVAKKHKHPISTWLIHGCDGCCATKKMISYTCPKCNEVSEVEAIYDKNLLNMKFVKEMVNFWYCKKCAKEYPEEAQKARKKQREGLAKKAGIKV